MKIELSEDQNTLTVNGTEYSAETVDLVEHGCPKCAFYTQVGVSKECSANLANNWCMFRKDDRMIVWIKKEVAK